MLPSPFARLFGMVSAPFDNEQYRNQGNKATRKPNCYQKVIICTSEPRRRIFVYGGAIFALPEVFFFGWYKISIAPEAQMKPRRLCLFLL